MLSMPGRHKYDDHGHHDYDDSPNSQHDDGMMMSEVMIDGWIGLPLLSS